MSQNQTPPTDDFLIRCPRLGHQIHFSYCRTENSGEPCFKTLDCWYPHFQVSEYLRSELMPEQWQRLTDRNVKPKVISLVEMIDNARRSAKK